MEFDTGSIDKVSEKTSEMGDKSVIAVEEGKGQSFYFIENQNEMAQMLELCNELQQIEEESSNCSG